MINVVSTAQSTVNHCYLSKAPFELGALKAALFPNGTADASATYKCSQSLFKCDLLFNPDPTVQDSAVNMILEFNLLFNHDESTFYIVNIRFLWDRSRWTRLGTDTIRFQVAFMERSGWPLGQSGHCHLTWHGWSRCHHRKMWSRMSFSSSNLENHDDQNQVHSKKHISIKLSGGVLRSMYRDNGDEAKLLQWKNFALADFWLQFVLTEHIIHDVTRQSSHICIYDVSCSGPMMTHGGWWP